VAKKKREVGAHTQRRLRDGFDTFALCLWLIINKLRAHANYIWTMHKKEKKTVNEGGYDITGVLVEPNQ